MRVVYLDCFSGVSGDMLLGALLDAGVDYEALFSHLQSLGLPGLRLELRPVRKCSLSAKQVEVLTDTDQPERHLRDILELFNGSTLPLSVVKQAGEVFQRLAAVEAHVHQVSPEEIHFHEIGAADSIVDIVGTILGFHLLGVEKVYFSPLPYGRGVIRCQHGTLPNPSPAALELLKGVPIYQVDAEGELVTPTGAVLVTSLGTFAASPPPMRVNAIGYGAGSRDLSWPNVLRLWLGEAEDSLPAAASSFNWEAVYILETTIDDMNPEWMPHLRNRLEETGAIDAWWKPVLMKKGRSGLELTVLSSESKVDPLIQVILEESTTLGVRVRKENRCCLERRELSVTTPYGIIHAKQAWFPSPEGRSWRVKPEYESCRELAERHKVPIHQVYAAFWKALEMPSMDLANRK
ncbi:MAG: nickel pincer cofactor biosynthesis protein LarC [Firmicutes bacterium]|nr:nickel pincer cofactor biosynthesis protein LarC [Bacillota bacterium]